MTFDYNVSGKKWNCFVISLTLSTLNRFSQFFHCWKAHKIYNKVQIILFATPQLCCCTTWKFGNTKGFNRLYFRHNFDKVQPIFAIIVWIVLQEKVYKTRITDLDDLKHRIRAEWITWITQWWLQLCVSGVVVFPLVSGQSSVISNTAFNSDVVF